MLGERDAIATLAVSDLTVAARFYEDTLGLTRVGAESTEAVVYRAGRSTILVYESEYAGTNRATAVTWVVGDGLDGVVRDLAAKGVRFEHYDLPGTVRDGDVHVAGDIRLAWFKDPDGNIHALANR